MAKIDLPQGWTCKCGHFTRFTSWVFAHWTDELTAKCEQCKRIYTLEAGEVELYHEPPGTEIDLKNVNVVMKRKRKR